MKPGHVLALFGVWQVSTMAAVGLTWAVASSKTPPPVKVEVTLPGIDGDLQPQTAPRESRMLPATDQEDGRMRARLTQMQAERAALGKDYLRLAFRQMLDSAGPAAARSARAPVSDDSLDQAPRRGERLRRLQDAFDRIRDTATQLEPDPAWREWARASGGLLPDLSPLTDLLVLLEDPPTLDALRHAGPTPPDGGPRDPG